MNSKRCIHKVAFVVGVVFQTNACTSDPNAKSVGASSGSSGYGDVVYPDPVNPPNGNGGGGGSGAGGGSAGHGQASVEFGAPPPPTQDYVLDAETATSKTTGLMWLRTTLDTRFTGGSCVDRCQALAAAGKEDWRAPTLDELKGILVLRDHCPLIDEDAFPLTLCSWYTSSDTMSGSGDDYFMLSFYSGEVKTRSAAFPKDTGFPCRCVR